MFGVDAGVLVTINTIVRRALPSSSVWDILPPSVKPTGCNIPILLPCRLQDLSMWYFFSCPLGCEFDGEIRRRIQGNSVEIPRSGPLRPPLPQDTPGSPQIHGFPSYVLGADSGVISSLPGSPRAIPGLLGSFQDHPHPLPGSLWELRRTLKSSPRPPKTLRLKLRLNESLECSASHGLLPTP